jgi:hypothetical protein
MRSYVNPPENFIPNFSTSHLLTFFLFYVTRTVHLLTFNRLTNKFT